MDIKTLIKQAGGVQRVADACGLRHSTVSEWERVPLAHVRTVAKLAGVEIELLIPGGEEADG